MGINLKKILSVGLAAALATTMCVSFADGDDDDGKGDKKRHIWNAFEPSVDTEETIVISLATNPIEPEGDTEAACVALQIGMNLLMKDLNGDEPGGKVTPADSVKLFLTLDGVELVYPGNDFSSPDCLTPNPPPDDYKSLDALLTGFTKLGGEIEICPLCWKARLYGGTTPTHEAEVADAFDIHALFLYADKVIAF